MADPYKVLGVSPSASEEDITQAYRKLAKKYHPDLNPGNKQAEEQMREVNAAYEQIKSGKYGEATYQREDGSYGPQQRSRGYTYQGGRGSAYNEDDEDFDWANSPFGDFFRQWENQQKQQQRTGGGRMADVEACIRSHQFQRAIQILSRMVPRDAEWYYYSAMANAGVGNRVTALNHAKEAARQEPGNREYQTLLSQYQRGIFNYRQTGQGYGFSMRTAGTTMMGIILAQIFCMFCCRPC